LELVWAPNGDQIAYPTESAIFVGPADGGEARKRADAVDPSCLSWSPDGKRIAFTSGNLGYLSNLNLAPSSIWVVEVEGGEPVRVTKGGHVDFSPAWKPDGKGLLFVSNRGGGRDIYLVSVDSSGQPSGEPERLTTGLDVFTMATSADGRRLSYSVATLRQNIWSLPVPSEGAVSLSEARPVTTGSQVIEAVGVSENGKWLAFGSDQGDEVSLFKMPVGGSEPVQLTTAPTIGQPSWSPDGKEIAFHTFRTGNRDIFVISADGGTARQLTNHSAHEFYPHWSPDGTRLVFHSARTGAPEIYVVSKDKGELSGETPVQLTFDGWAIAPRWSPDGRLIAYESGSGVSVIPSGGGPPRRLTDFGGRPMWSKDSRALYFIVGKPDERAGIWSVPSSGGAARRLVRFDDPTRRFYFDWSSEGETFYFLLAEFEADVWVMEIEDSTK
jgi:TolB protein